MSKPLFFILRHGTTAANEAGSYRGWLDNLETQLSPEGKDMAREAGLFLKDLPFEKSVIFCSNLGRTNETSEIVASILGIQEIEEMPELRPLNVGDFAGKSKQENPLEKYVKNKQLKLPGGESIADFEKRQSAFFDALLATIETTGVVPIIVCHTSNVTTLWNLFNHDERAVEDHEDVLQPGGVGMFANNVLIPVLKKGSEKVPLKDGTAISGFVTDEDNRPPRECWNCRWFVRDVNHLGGCTHPLVQIDPVLQSKKQNDGTIGVGDRDCCDSFQNKIST